MKEETDFALDNISPAEEDHLHFCLLSTHTHLKVTQLSENKHWL